MLNNGTPWWCFNSGQMTQRWPDQTMRLWTFPTTHHSDGSSPGAGNIPRACYGPKWCQYLQRNSREKQMGGMKQKAATSQPSLWGLCCRKEGANSGKVVPHTHLSKLDHHPFPVQGESSLQEFSEVLALLSQDKTNSPPSSDCHFLLCNVLAVPGRFGSHQHPVISCKQ